MPSYLAEIELRLKRVEQIVAVSAVELNRTESMNNFIHIIIRERRKKENRSMCDFNNTLFAML